MIVQDQEPRMSRNLTASMLTGFVALTGFACGAGNADLYATMPTEIEVASVSVSAPRPSASAVALAQAEEPEPVEFGPAPASEEDDDEPAEGHGIIGVLGGPVAIASSSAFGVLGGIDTSSGVGGLGLRGMGTGGTRTGSVGVGTTAPPQVRAGVVTVKGQLPSEIVQRVVRARHASLRLCYESALLRRPSLQGTMTVRFVVGAAGSVLSASEVGPGLSDAPMSSCVLGAFRSLTFPKPKAGIAVVNYPIVFSKPASARPNARP